MRKRELALSRMELYARLLPQDRINEMVGRSMLVLALVVSLLGGLLCPIACLPSSIEAKPERTSVPQLPCHKTSAPAGEESRLPAAPGPSPCEHCTHSVQAIKWDKSTLGQGDVPSAVLFSADPFFFDVAPQRPIDTKVHNNLHISSPPGLTSVLRI